MEEERISERQKEKKKEKTSQDEMKQINKETKKVFEVEFQSLKKTPSLVSPLNKNRVRMGNKDNLYVIFQEKAVFLCCFLALYCFPRLN